MTDPDKIIDYGRFEVHQAKMPNGHTHSWISPGDCVAVLPYDDKGFWLGLQYRRPVDQNVLSTCAGMIDPGESPAAAAHRELHEEFGMWTDNMHLLGGFYTSEGVSDEYTHVFAAENPVLDPNGATDLDEGITVVQYQWSFVPLLLENSDNAKLKIALMSLERQRTLEALQLLGVA